MNPMTETPEPQKISKEKQLQIRTMEMWFGTIIILLVGFVLFPFLKILPPEKLRPVQIVMVFVVIVHFCFFPGKRVLKK
jgi:Na+/melibiose symporter-like transporter